MPPFSPESNSTVERRVEASVAQMARLANRGSEKELVPRPLRPPLGQHPCFLEEAGGGETARTSMSLLCLNRPRAVCRSFPFLSSPSPFAKWEAVISSKSRAMSAVISRPHGIPGHRSASLSRKPARLCLSTRCSPWQGRKYWETPPRAPDPNGGQATAHEQHFSYPGS